MKVEMKSQDISLQSIGDNMMTKLLPLLMYEPDNTLFELFDIIKNPEQFELNIEEVGCINENRAEVTWY